MACAGHWPGILRVSESTWLQSWQRVNVHQIPFALLRAYARIGPERGGFHLARAARRLVPRSKWSDVFQTGEGVRLGLDLSTYPDFSMAAGLYELETARLLRRILKPGMHVMDAGANIGFFTCRMARQVGARGRVDAIEPDPKNRARLEENLARNRIEVIGPDGCSLPSWSSSAPALRSNAATAHSERDSAPVAALPRNAGALAGVSVHARALSDRAEPLTFHRPAPGTRRNHGESGRFPRGDVATEPYDVQTARLDEEIQGVPDLVKLDLEGSERLTLRGATRWLQSERPPIWIIEHNPAAESRAGHRPGDVWRDLLRHVPRYRCFFIGTALRPLASPEQLDALPRQGNVLFRPG